MEGTLKFTLPDESSEFNQARMGPELFLCLHELDNELRNYQKYGNGREDPDAFITGLRKTIWDTLCKLEE